MKTFGKISSNSILFIALILSFFSCFESHAQNAVVIGGNTPNPNAVLLLIGSGSQGLVLPITSDPTSITKIQGMIVYNKSDNKIYYCDGSTWKAATNGSGSSASQTLTLSGNSLSISDGNNVTIAAAAPTQSGQVLMWDGSQWTASSSTAPTITGQVLKWNNTTKSWEAGVDAGGTSYLAGTGISITGTTIANTGVTNVSATAPISVISPTTTPAISITQATTSTDGYLSKVDWNTFNGKVGLASAPASGEISGNYNAGFQLVAGSVQDVDVNNSAAIAGTKISPNFGSQDITTTGKTVLNTVSYGWPGTQGSTNTFLKNDGSGNLTWTASSTGVSSVSGTAPVTVTNATTTPSISMSQANTTTDGYLSKADWNTFSSKLDVTSTPAAGDISGNYSTGLQLGAGVILNADINAAAAIAGTKISPDFGTQNITTTGKTVLNTVSYGWPGTQGAASTYLNNDGAGNLTWVTASPAGFTTDKIIPRGNGTTLVASQLYDDGTKVGIGTTTPVKKLDVSGDINISSASSFYVNNLRFFRDAAATSNTYIGEEAGVNSIEDNASNAHNNLFVGFQSGKQNTSGQYNTFIAPGAGAANTAGSFNLYVGSDAGLNMVTGNLNTFVGFNAGKNSNGIISTTFLGNKAGESNTTGQYNTYVGERAGQVSTTGSENTFVGRQVGVSHRTANQITLIGSQTDIGSDVISNATAIGYQATVKVSDAIVLGKPGTKVGIGLNNPAFPLDVVGDGNFTGNVHAANVVAPSDIRWKENVITLDRSLAKVMKLRGVEYSWNEKASEIGIHDDTRQIGFIAQELESVIPELVCTDDKGHKSVKYANITAVLVEAVKEQQSQIDVLKKTIEALEAKLKLYETKESQELSVIHAELKKLNELVGLEAKAEKK